MPAEKEYITIGRIINTQGTRGEVRVLPLTDFPERFADMKTVLTKLGDRMERRVMENTYRHGKFIIVKFAAVDDMNAAEALKHSLLMVTRNELTPLPEGSHYIFDIIGLDVHTCDGRPLGKVTDVIQTGANDVYVVERDNRKPLLIPALKQVVREINIQAGKMTVDLPPGLEDL